MDNAKFQPTCAETQKNTNSFDLSNDVRDLFYKSSVGIMTRKERLIMRLRKIITMGLAAIMAVSAMGMTAMATEIDKNNP